MKNKRNSKPKNMGSIKKPKHILMHPHYPIGHATGLTEDEWQKFADSYEHS